MTLILIWETLSPRVFSSPSFGLTLPLDIPCSDSQCQTMETIDTLPGLCHETDLIFSCSFADPECLSRTPDLGSQSKNSYKRGKKNCCPTFFVDKNITKFKKYFLNIYPGSRVKNQRIPDPDRQQCFLKNV
jgi:hypothetical protein